MASAVGNMRGMGWIQRVHRTKVLDRALMPDARARAFIIYPKIQRARWHPNDFDSRVTTPVRIMICKSGHSGVTMHHRRPMYSKPERKRVRVSEDAARTLLQNMDQALRNHVYETVGVCARDRDARAIQYLRDPVHLAQLNVEVINGNLLRVR